MPEIPEGFAPARYKGHGMGLQEGARYYNADGTWRESLSLEPGDEILLRDEDVYGKTLLHDPNQNARSQYIGLGKVAKPEHAGKSDTELQASGYEWHLCRPDFEPVEPLEDYLKRREKPAEGQPQEVPQTITIDKAPDVPVQEESEQS